MTAEEFMQLIDSNGPASWAEYEFKAAVFGMQAGRDFCMWMLALTKVWAFMTPIVAEGVLSSTAWECFKTDVGLVMDICEMFDSRKKWYARDMQSSNILRMVNELTVATRVCGIDPPFNDGTYLPYQTRKYTLLDAVERRFPLLPVKYYAVNARAVHASDEQLAIWIKQRLSKRADESETFRKIYKSMVAAFVNNHFTATVFMK